MRINHITHGYVLNRMNLNPSSHNCLRFHGQSFKVDLLFNFPNLRSKLIIDRLQYMFLKCLISFYYKGIPGNPKGIDLIPDRSLFF